MKGLRARVRAYAARTLGAFGWRFLLFLGASQMCLKGAAYYLSISIMLPLLKNVYGTDAYWFQLYSMVAMIPWSLKPILGLLSDLLLCCGYHKRFWLANALVVGLAGCGGLFFMRSPAGLALCFGAIQYEVALFDLLSEGAYSAQMHAHPETGSTLVVLVQVFQYAGGLAAMSFAGPMADAALFYALFGITAGVCLLPALPALLGWLPEQRFPYGVPLGNPTLLSRLGVHRGREVRERGMVAVIAFTGLAAPAVAIVSTLFDAGYGVSVALLFIVASLLGAHAVFPRLVFYVALYQVLSLVCAPSIGGALDYFYTADETCVAGGPHFSFAYYQTYAGLVGTACSFAGAAIYQFLLSGMRFRRVFLFTSVLKALVGFSDVIIVRRWNTMVGVPDHVAYIVGEAVMEPVISMLNYIPSSALLARACVPGMESSTFAFLAGVNNFAAMLSNMEGALLFRALGVRTTPPCNFDALWILILVCHFALPLVVGVAGCFLIPNTKQDERLDGEGNVMEEEKVEERELQEYSAFSEDDGVDLLGESSVDGEIQLL